MSCRPTHYADEPCPVEREVPEPVGPTTPVRREEPVEACIHEWVETSAFAGRFCSRCHIDYDDHDANPHEVEPRGVTL